jgi:hypothetical protein
MSRNTHDIDAALAAAQPEALALLKQFARDDNPRASAEARRILRRYAERLDEAIEADRFAQARRRERNLKDDIASGDFINKGRDEHGR